MTMMMKDLKNQEIGGDKRDNQRIKEMLQKGRTASAIADFCGYSLEKVEAVEKELKLQPV